SDDSGLRRRGSDGHERVPPVRALGRAGDGPGHGQQQESAEAGRARTRELPALGMADQVRSGEERRASRRQDAPRVRRIRVQARHGARALPARRQGRLGDGSDERGTAPVRRQSRPARVRVARLLEPDVQPARGRERAEEARRRRQAGARRAAAPGGGRTGGEGAGEGGVMATATRPRLLVPGLLPADPTRETYRVRPGASTTVVLQPDDRLTVRDVHGAQRALLLSEEFGAADLFGPASPPGAEETFRATRAGAVTVTAPDGEPVVAGGVPASDLQLEIRRAAPRAELEPALPEP